MNRHGIVRLFQLDGPIMVTGHTGFKGTWLSILLQELGIPSIGFSLPPERDSLYLKIPVEKRIDGVYGDIRNRDELIDFFNKYKPSAIIHLAAQPLVTNSYKNPLETFSVNVLGTAQLLDVAFNSKNVQAIAVATTDKVYKNLGFGRPFTETDTLGGSDPYSASKVGTETVLDAWREISKNTLEIPITSLRAGNVVGGGDLASNRLLPDLVRGFMNSTPVKIRNPRSIRPWQHVLDPLWGYLMALSKSIGQFENYIPAYNFSVNGIGLTVKRVVEISNSFIPVLYDTNFEDKSELKITESKILNLDSSLARNSLGWESHWSQELAIESTLNWWIRYLKEVDTPYSLCLNEIHALLESNGIMG